MLLLTLNNPRNLISGKVNIIGEYRIPFSLVTLNATRLQVTRFSETAKEIFQQNVAQIHYITERN